MSGHGNGAGHFGHHTQPHNGGQPVPEPLPAYHHPPHQHASPSQAQQQKYEHDRYSHDSRSHGQQWYGHHHHQHQHHHGQPFPEGRPQSRSQTWAKYVLRQLGLIVPFIILILNINIYATRRGRYLNNTTDATDPVFYALWLTVPLSGAVLLWGIANIISMRRAPYRGGIPHHVTFGVELLFTLGSAICWILLIMHIVSKQAMGYYEYPFLPYEGALAFLLGLLMLTNLGLCVGALRKFNRERKRRENVTTLAI